jgi:hypothetical protein
MRGVILAWAVGMGIITYRSLVKEHKPPVPGQMLAATALFAGLAVVGEYQPAATAAALFAFGVDVAVLMQVLPGGGTKAGTANNAKTPNNKGSAPTPTGA